MKALTLLILYLSSACFGQTIRYEWVDVSLYRLPLHPLNVIPETLSVSVTDLGGQLSSLQIEDLEKTISIPGYTKQPSGTGVRIEIVISPLAITIRELKDNPFAVEKEGVRTVYHNYNYFLSCSLPTKLRIILNNGQILEHDLPAFFQATYPGQGATTEAGMLTRWENDNYYLKSLLRERLELRVKEINQFLASQYGRGTVRHYIGVGYIKDKAHGYEDFNRAASAIRDVLLFASNKESYVGDNSFIEKYQFATRILLRLLKESDSHQKVRIHQKIRGAICYNLALAAFAAYQFEQADEYLRLTSESGRNTLHETTILLERINDQRRRHQANGITPTPGTSHEAGNPKDPPATEIFTDYIVGLQNDTLEVEFIVPSTDAMPFGDSVWLQEKIIIASEARAVIELLPDQIKSFCYNGKHYEALWWVEATQTTPWTIARKFCRRILTGAVPVFSCNEVTTDAEGYKGLRSNLYYKEEEQYKPASFFNFNRGVSRLVSQHPNLAKEVREGTYDRDQFVSILRQYNSYLEPKVSH